MNSPIVVKEGNIESLTTALDLILRGQDISKARSNLSQQASQQAEVSMHTLLDYSPVGGSSSFGLRKVYEAWEVGQRR